MNPEQPFDFDVALSYAGEERSYVHEVANCLRERGVRVFFDEFFTAELWGQDLYTYLDNVYRERARFTVVFISQSYVSKPWPSHERQSAQARALNELGPYLLPVRFDTSDLPGLRPTVSYLDAAKITPDQLAQLILDKLSDTPGGATPSPVAVGVPRTTDEQRQLLITRPADWEYRLFASVLLIRRGALEGKWLDNEIRYAARTGVHMDRKTAIEYISSKSVEALMIIDGLMRVLDPNAQEAAFGLVGEPGDAVSIEHLATRVIDVYEELLDWAANLRGMGVPKELRTLFELNAQLANKPIRQIRQLVDYYAAQVENLPEKLADGETINLEIPLKIEIDDDNLSNLNAEFKRLNGATPTS